MERTAAGFRIKLEGDWLEARPPGAGLRSAQRLARCWPGVDARIAELLGMVPYSSSMTVALGFDAADFARPPVGFGFLVPKKERRRLVACTWVGTKFSHRVPDGKMVARCFLGGAEDAARAGRIRRRHRRHGDGRARRDRRHHAPGRASAASSAGRARWRNTRWAIRGTWQELEARVAAIPGLHLAGNAYHGIGIPDCIRMGKAAAGRFWVPRRPF